MKDKNIDYEKERNELASLLNVKVKNKYVSGVVGEMDLLKGTARIDYEEPKQFNGSAEMPVWSFIYTNYSIKRLRKFLLDASFPPMHYKKIKKVKTIVTTKSEG